VGLLAFVCDHSGRSAAPISQRKAAWNYLKIYEAKSECVRAGEPAAELEYVVSKEQVEVPPERGLEGRRNRGRQAEP
jgi:hypothetical protein